MIWIPVITSIVAIAVIVSVAPGKIPQQAMDSARVFCGLNCAHRGLYTKDQTIPENSMEAFIAARDKGYGVELDVHLSADGQVVVFHDYELQRVCGVAGRIGETEYSQLSKLRLFGTKQRIPLLTEVLEILGDTPVIVEIKPSETRNALLAEKVYNILQDNGGNWCIQSFDPRICAWYKKNAPNVLRGQLGCPPREYVGISRISSLFIGNLLLNFLSRPHYVAYKNNPYPLIVKLCMLMKPIKAVWTVSLGQDAEKAEMENDIVIFEHYTPAPRFRQQTAVYNDTNYS